MTCRQAFDIDLAAFVAEPGAAAFERFRAHYSGCADCAAEPRPSLLDHVRALVLHPAFAYALVLVLAYPAVRSRRGRFDEGTTATGGPAGVATLPGVDRATAGERVTLRVPAPPAAGGSLEVRVAARDGRREIRERIDQPAGAAPLVLEVPAVWLEPGSYAVEVCDPASGDEPVATYGLTVR